MQIEAKDVESLNAFNQSSSTSQIYSQPLNSIYEFMLIIQELHFFTFKGSI